MVWLKAMLAGALLAYPALAAAADASPPPLPGGSLDTRFPGIDVYLALPVRARTPAGAACAAGQAYVDRINAGRFRAVGDLFTADGVAFHPPGHFHRGVAAIGAFYEATIGPQRPVIVPVGYVGSGNDCFVQLASKLEIDGQTHYMLASVDLFTVDRTGKLTRMIAFGRSEAARALRERREAK